MEPRKWALVVGVLLVGVISGNFAQSSGRSAKVLEDPTIPQQRTSHEFSLQEPSNHAMSRSGGNNMMMMYRTVFAISLKLLTLFLIFKLLGGSFSIGAQHGPMGQFPAGSGWPAMQMQGQGWQAMQGGQGWQAAPGGGEGGSGEQGGQGQGGYSSGGNQNQATSFVTATSTGAAAGASTGGAAGVVGLAQGVPHSGYISSAGNSPRPSFLSFPRFRFGGLRLPPPRHAGYPPQHMMMAQPGPAHNMGTETHVVETHSHMYVLPDGTHARIPGSGPGPAQGGATPIKSVESSSSSTSQNSDTEAKSSSSDTVAESRPVETIVSSSSSSSSSSPQVAERRSSLAYREKLGQLQQAYEDWSLHFNPGTRSL